MVYTKGDPTDERLHQQQHSTFTEGLLFKGWNNERVVHQDQQGRIIAIESTDPPAHLQKVRDVGAILEGSMGHPEDWSLAPGRQVLLYISSSRRVVGCLVAEVIKRAFAAAPARPTLHDGPRPPATGVDAAHGERGTSSLHPPSGAPATSRPLGGSDLHPPSSSAVPLLPSTSSRERVAIDCTPGVQQLPCCSSSRAGDGGDAADAALQLPGSCMGGGSQCTAAGPPHALAGRPPPCSGSAGEQLPSTCHPNAAPTVSASCVEATSQCRQPPQGPAREAGCSVSTPAYCPHQASTCPGCATAPAAAAAAAPAPAAGLSGSSTAPALQQRTVGAGQGLPAVPEASGRRSQPSVRPGQEAAPGATSAPTAHAAASAPGRLIVPGSAAGGAAQAASCAAHPLRAAQPPAARGVPQAGLPAGSVGARAAGKRRRPCSKTARGEGLVVVDRKRVVKALCGVRLVWVSPKHRRRGIAKKLLAAARRQLVMGYVVPREQVAFYHPTSDGLLLLRSFHQTTSAVAVYD